jgi:hypothetical protein
LFARTQREEGHRLRWSHLRRKFYEVYVGGHSPIATEALARIKQFYAIEDEIRGLPPELRRRARQDRSRAIIEGGGSPAYPGPVTSTNSGKAA